MSHNKHVVDIESIDGLYGYGLMLTRNPAEAEDLVQETYVRALGAIERLHADSNVRGWMFTILRNIWLNQLRGWRHASLVSIDEGGNVANSIGELSKGPHELYVDKELRQQVRDAISQLPIAFAEIILLREYEDLSYQDIAKVLDCPLGTVMSRLGRARSRLRTILGSAVQSRASARRKAATQEPMPRARESTAAADATLLRQSCREPKRTSAKSDSSHWAARMPRLTSRVCSAEPNARFPGITS
jgi:RNA polymerase sigma-70 factor (ECF subfamily)